MPHSRPGPPPPTVDSIVARVPMPMCHDAPAVRREEHKQARSKHNPKAVCASNGPGAKFFPVILRKLTTVLALAALATASAGDATSLCRIACASRAASLGSSKFAFSRDLSHSHAVPENAAMHHHMSRTANSQAPALTAFSSMVALQLPQCSQYRQFAALLSGASTAVASGLSESSVVAANAPATVVEATTRATSLLTESPPDSAVPLLSTTSVLRI